MQRSGRPNRTMARAMVSKSSDPPVQLMSLSCDLSSMRDKTEEGVPLDVGRRGDVETPKHSPIHSPWVHVRHVPLLLRSRTVE